MHSWDGIIYNDKICTLKQKQAKLSSFSWCSKWEKWEKCTIDIMTWKTFDSSNSGLPQLHSFVYCFIDNCLIKRYKCIYINDMPNLTLNIWLFDTVICGQQAKHYESLYIVSTSCDFTSLFPSCFHL